MKKIDWYYHRKGCKTCGKSDSFLEQHGATVERLVDCKKEPVDEQAIAGLLATVSEVHAVRGTSLKQWTGPNYPPEAGAAILGPTGNLRAPSLIQGNRLLVGFHEGLYTCILLQDV